MVDNKGKSGANKSEINTINVHLALLFVLGGLFVQITVRQIKHLNNIVDQYQVRSWVGWYRHFTFVMLALAFLTKLRWELKQTEVELIEKKVQNHPMRSFLKSRRLA